MLSNQRNVTVRVH